MEFRYITNITIERSLNLTKMKNCSTHKIQGTMIHTSGAQGVAFWYKSQTNQS